MPISRGIIGRAVTVVALLFLAAPVGAAGRPAQTTTTVDRGSYDPYTDPGYDPYADPGYDNGTYDPYADEAFYSDPCDPAFHPDWQSDPYCNPALVDGTSEPAFGSWSTTFGGYDSIEETPLTEITTEDAPMLGANRMLLAIDSLAELSLFSRSGLPEAGALVRDIRTAIPADGLTESGYRDELSRFSGEFGPFLESLASSGTLVSAELWSAADELALVVASGELGAGATGIMDPDPWIAGIGDLLRRGGETASFEERPADAAAVRQVLAAFEAASVADASPPDLAFVPETQIDPTPTPLKAPDPDAEPESSFPWGLIAMAAGALVIAVTVATEVLGRRSRSRRPLNDAPSPLTAVHTSDGASSGGGLGSDGELTAAARAALATAMSTLTANDANAPSVADLLDASRRMTSTLDTAAVAAIALAEVQRLVDADGGIIVRRGQNGLDPVSCEPPMLFNYERVEDGCLPRVVETGRATASIVHDDPLLAEVPMAMAAVPIVADGVVGGAILVVRVSARPFTRTELDSLEMLAPLIGSAFTAADTHETATELMDVEPLTGLQNRRRLDLDLAAISPDDEVAYVMVDIDHFKRFNDSNGHAAGDEALRRVSAILQAAVRPSDLVYRYGGEEFCVLLPGATAEEAEIVAERARAAVEAAHIPGMENQPDGRITISVGVSHSAWTAPCDLVEKADAALYRSKRNGRNQVSLHR